jgi:EpsI family protein
MTTPIVGAACLLLIIGTPWYLSAAMARSSAQRSPPGESLRLPGAERGWRGPQDAVDSWRPPFAGAVAERATTYVDPSGHGVDVYVGVYELGGTGEAEMISYGNRLYPQEHRSLLTDRPAVAGSDAAPLPAAREILVPAPDGDRVVWYWFMIGESATSSRNAAKALEALAIISGRADYGRIVTLATSATDLDGARRRLDAFVLDHGACVRGGFSPRNCAG